MGFARATHLARAWGGDIVDLGHAGHINVASGFGPWAKGKALRDDLMMVTTAEPIRPAQGRRIAL